MIDAYLAVDADLEQLMRWFHWLKAEQILAALDYYRALPEEINAILRAGIAEVPEHLRDEFGGHLRKIM